MNGVNIVIAVVWRERSNDYIKYFHKYNANFVFSYLCEGTAKQKYLHLWGLEKRAMQVICCLCRDHAGDALLSGLVNDMRIDAPNAGVAFMLPVAGLAGISQKHAEEPSEDFEKKVEQMQYSLIITIAEGGYVDMVMDAARDAGARGGTVIHAKGTGAQFISKFFGLTIAEEKELIYLVTRKESEDAIIKAIIDKAGPDTEARAVAFTVPVEKVAGFSRL